MGRREEHAVGSRFGRVTVVSEVDVSERLTAGGKRREFVLQCSCGKIVQRPLKGFISGRYVSCGCHGQEARLRSCTTHGMSQSRPYRIWAHIIERCDNPNSMYYMDYGGRGVSYPQKWVTFEGFWDDMHKGYSDDLEIDRIDPNKDYNKSNCRWTTESMQAYNQRLRGTNTSGRTGVYKSKAKDSWWAEIRKDGRNVFLGTYHSFDAACAARAKAELEVYGFTKS